MANKNPSPANQFKPGVSPNPGGKPVGSRNALRGAFMRALAQDFAEHGAVAIVETRQSKPAEYLKIIASLMPKELEIKRPLEDMTDDDLIAGVAALQSYLNAGGSNQRAGDAAQPKQTGGLPGLH